MPTTSAPATLAASGTSDRPNNPGMAAASANGSSPAVSANDGARAFMTAFARWVNAPDEYDLAQLIREALGQLKTIASGT